MTLVQFNKSEMNSAKKRIRNFLKTNGFLPNSARMKDKNTGKTIKVKKREYEYLFEAQHLFLRNNGYQPNWVTMNGESDNAVVQNYQTDVYTCCVYSFQMCGQYLFDWISPSKIKKAFKTNVNGTTPANLIAGAKSLGYKVTPISRTYDAVKKCLDNGFPVIAHIQTAGNTRPACLGYKYDYGHYVHINKAKDNKFLVADPTKGLKWCVASQIIKATGGRDIQFYKVEIL